MRTQHIRIEKFTSHYILNIEIIRKEAIASDNMMEPPLSRIYYGAHLVTLSGIDYISPDGLE